MDYVDHPLQPGENEFFEHGLRKERIIVAGIIIRDYNGVGSRPDRIPGYTKRHVQDRIHQPMRKFRLQEEVHEQVLESVQEYRPHKGGAVPKEDGLFSFEPRH
jgi:hypothetical protein